MAKGKGLGLGFYRNQVSSKAGGKYTTSMHNGMAHGGSDAASARRALNNMADTLNRDTMKRDSARRVAAGQPIRGLDPVGGGGQAPRGGAGGGSGGGS